MRLTSLLFITSFVHTVAFKEELGQASMIGELLMPSGVLLDHEGLRPMLKDYFEAFFRAGVEVVRDGRISTHTELSVQKPPFAPEDFFSMANASWDQKLAETGIN